MIELLTLKEASKHVDAICDLIIADYTYNIEQKMRLFDILSNDLTCWVNTGTIDSKWVEPLVTLIENRKHKFMEIVRMVNEL